MSGQILPDSGVRVRTEWTAINSKRTISFKCYQLNLIRRLMHQPYFAVCCMCLYIDTVYNISSTTAHTLRDVIGGALFSQIARYRDRFMCLFVQWCFLHE